jgi:Ser/Thr protein kinase RdoA (MazF antagonist)
VTVDTRTSRPLYRFCVPTPGRMIELARAGAARPALDQRTLDAILAQYAARARGRARSLPFGWRNRSVVVRTNLGTNVVKGYRRSSKAASIVHEHSVLRHLASVAYPAPRVRSTSQGDTLVIVDDRHYALFDFIHGVNLGGCFLSRGTRLRLSEEAGRVLAQLHRALDGFSPSGRQELGFTSLTGERVRDASWHLRQLTALASTPGNDSLAARDGRWRWLASNSGRIGDEISRLDRALSQAPLSRLVIHGDYGLHNLMFRRDGSATVLDFELARMEWRMVDLAVVLSRVDVTSGRAFLAGYRALAPIPADEWRLLPDVWRFYRLCGAIRSWHTSAMRGGDERLSTARTRVEEADRISQHRLAPWE